jgi:hypothetical protein
LNLLPGKGAGLSSYPGDRGVSEIPEPAVVFDNCRCFPEGIYRFISSATRDFFRFQGEYPKIFGLESDSFPCGRSWLRFIPLPRERFDPYPRGPAGSLSMILWFRSEERSLGISSGDR